MALIREKSEAAKRLNVEIEVLSDAHSRLTVESTMPKLGLDAGITLEGDVSKKKVRRHTTKVSMIRQGTRDSYQFAEVPMRGSLKDFVVWCLTSGPFYGVKPVEIVEIAKQAGRPINPGSVRQQLRVLWNKDGKIVRLRAKGTTKKDDTYTMDKHTLVGRLSEHDVIKPKPKGSIHLTRSPAGRRQASRMVGKMKEAAAT